MITVPVAPVADFAGNLALLLTFFFGFLPEWALLIMAAGFALFVAVLALRLLLFLKDLFWPF